MLALLLVSAAFVLLLLRSMPYMVVVNGRIHWCPCMLVGVYTCSCSQDFITFFALRLVCWVSLLQV